MSFHKAAPTGACLKVQLRLSPEPSQGVQRTCHSQPTQTLKGVDQGPEQRQCCPRSPGTTTRSVLLLDITHLLSGRQSPADSLLRLYKSLYPQNQMCNGHQAEPRGGLLCRGQQRDGKEASLQTPTACLPQDLENTACCPHRQ